MVISWAFKNNFQTDGSFNDRYFQENSKNIPNSHWILISMDGYIPSNLSNNITIIKKKEGIFKYDFFSFIKILITITFDCRFSPRKIFHYLSFPSYFANIISLTVKKELEKGNYKAILLPYEGKPFQHTAFIEAKKFDKKITTIGYLHSLLAPCPCEHVYRSGAPDLLLVHGESLIEILKTKLNWPKDKLRLTQSFRFRIDENRSLSLSKKIFLPSVISNNNNIKIFINEFKKLLINSPPNSFPKFDIRNHPARLNSKRHLNLKRGLEKIMCRYKECFSDNPLNKNISIFFGVTAATFEALESGIDAIHICSDPVFESHSEKIWPNLKVKQLNEFTFHYNIIMPKKYIDFGNKNKILNQILTTLF